ncbi:MAG TPA: hypothetical protein VHX63_12305 [Acidobacteriaceae bacterium]|jgi:hypothetical protein|nr:hypothetical protein [Acidobacteriaceae bacterium]
MRLFSIEIGRPQRYAALLLLFFAVQCFWVIGHQTLTEQDYQYARCGREIWEKPSPLAGYFTSCGNIHDGTFAYRAAGLPLTTQRIFAGQTVTSSTWESRHVLHYVNVLLHLPFIFFGVWLGGAIWWVSRRLYGNMGGFFALALYCFSPEMLRVCLQPNNEILAAWGMYGIVYTAIGVAHAMQGPQRRWRPRIALLMLALGLTATAHIAAALIGLLLALIFMLYLAEGRRAYVVQVLIGASFGAFIILFASYTFNADAFSYVFNGGAGRMWFSLDGTRYMFQNLSNAGITIAAATALVLYAVHRRSRYFGNTAPLLVAALLLCLVTTSVRSEPWIWALPFVLTFTGGVFADLLESRHRRLYFWLAGAILITQAGLSLVSLPLLIQ